MFEWLRRIWYLLNRGRFERDLEREMAAHRAEMPDGVRFGSTLRLREEARDIWGWRWLDEFAQDARHAVRAFARSPGFTVVAVATLALGIGATTAGFSLMRAVLLDPLPYRDASRLVMVWEDGSQHGLPPNITPSPGHYVDWNDQNGVFDGMAALDFGSFNLTGAGEPLRVEGFHATHNLFDVLGVAPVLGRPFTREEEQPGAAVAILGHSLWQSRFGSSRDIVGRTIVLDEKPFTVVGVMPAGFDFPQRGTEIWTPVVWTPEQRRSTANFVLLVVARLRGSVTVQRAREEINTLALRLNRDQQRPFGAHITPLRDQFVGNTRTAVILLFVISTCVLLIASANLANLVLTRAVERRKDVALRMALGAGRGRVFRQLLTEHLILSAAGTILGLAIAAQGLDALSSLVPRNMTFARLDIDAGLLAFATALCTLTTLGLGAWPARLAHRLGLGDALRQADARAGESRAANRLRGWLLVSQVAFALVLLIAAGLMVQTFLRVRAVDPGFSGERVLTMRTDLPVPKYADHARRSAFYAEVLDRVQALPGVSSAGFTSFLPLGFSGGATGVSVEGLTEPPRDPANFRLVTPGYMPAMGMRLVRGRLLEDANREGTERVAVINETMARRYWPSDDSVGRRFRAAPCAECPWLRVVGVVVDVHQQAMRVGVKPEYFIPFIQSRLPLPFMAPKDLAIRASGDPVVLIDAVRRVIRAVDPQQPISQIKVMADYRNEDLAPQRFQAQLMGGFAALALLLASLGVYGVLSYSVAQRRREMGLRLALGAERNQLVRWVVRQGLAPVVFGLAVGLAAAYGLAHLIGNLLYEVQPRDPLTFGIAAIALFTTALLACWLPARRASRVDPFVVLRCE
jgi:putative ABC transport system permease protein